MTKLFWWTLLEGDYEEAAKVVSSRINYNRATDGQSKTIFGNACWPVDLGVDSNCANPSQVSCIMNTYYNEVMSRVIPEYDINNIYANTYPQTKSKAKIEAETEQIIQHVAQISGQAYFRVKEVLYNLYWATYGNTSDRLSYQYISPLQYKANQEKIQKPKNIGSGVTSAGEAVGGTFDGILTAGKWLLIAGAVGVGAYFLWPVISTIKK